MDEADPKTGNRDSVLRAHRAPRPPPGHALRLEPAAGVRRPTKLRHVLGGFPKEKVCPISCPGQRGVASQQPLIHDRTPSRSSTAVSSALTAKARRLQHPPSRTRPPARSSRRRGRNLTSPSAPSQQHQRPLVFQLACPRASTSELSIPRLRRPGLRKPERRPPVAGRHGGRPGKGETRARKRQERPSRAQFRGYEDKSARSRAAPRSRLPRASELRLFRLGLRPATRQPVPPASMPRSRAGPARLGQSGAARRKPGRAGVIVVRNRCDVRGRRVWSVFLWTGLVGDYARSVYVERLASLSPKTSMTASADTGTAPRPSTCATSRRHRSGQWKVRRTPLNHDEEFKAEENSLNVAAAGRRSIEDPATPRIPADDVHGRFRWLGLYAQRKQGVGGCQHLQAGRQSLSDEYFMQRIRLDGGR
ncbi:hypothetical protein QJS66_19715 [Kocuria rhizophila]|nr:hypothetical protein QJS66_19715 [Kocuria rhizophila]